MKIEIWSDVACPWCYIGKKRFEKALAQFEGADQIEVEWKSFLLNPDQITNTKDSLIDYLAREKGLTKAQAGQMTDQVSLVGSTEGIDFDFEKVVVASTVRAHALLQISKEKGLGAKVKQRLLHAYFTENVNIDDPEQLIRIAQEAGLDPVVVRESLTSEDPYKKVEQELQEARSLGIQGVPFFVIDRKYGISGAQETDTFLKALEQALSEWKEEQQKSLTIQPGESCSTTKGC